NTESTPASYGWLVDTTDPESAASSPAFSTSTSVTVTYSDSDPVSGGVASGVASVELWATSPGGSPVVDATDSGLGLDGRFVVLRAVDGSYEFYTVATDVSGNVEAVPVSADDSTFVDTRK